QRDFLEGKSQTSARDTFFYYSGKDPSAVRYKNWKMYFAMVSDSPAGFVTGGGPYPRAPGGNLKSDPLQTSPGPQIKTPIGGEGPPARLSPPTIRTGPSCPGARRCG